MISSTSTSSSIHQRKRESGERGIGRAADVVGFDGDDEIVTRPSEEGRRQEKKERRSVHTIFLDFSLSYQIFSKTVAVTPHMLDSHDAADVEIGSPDIRAGRRAGIVPLTPGEKI
jgi:hypothetical protein